MDTIYALATAQGRAGVSVVRISGPQSIAAAETLCGALPPVRVAAVRSIRDPSGALVDEALVIRFAGPASFTGEDVVELQLHGSVAVVEAVLRLLGAVSGTRMAEPGEFTRRALENGRLDLAQVEGLADLIDAETEAQRKQAVRILSGALGERVESWRRDLVRAAALLEASIDFADEEVPVDVSDEVAELLERVREDLEKQISGVAISERIRSGFEVAIVGPPNAGKSTLLNALVGRDAAITSEIAGTTRDVIEVRMDLAGVPVTLLDTAGLRESEDIVEGIGIERAIQRAGQADLRVFLADAPEGLGLSVEPHDIVVKPKQDTVCAGVRGISGITGQGIPELLHDLSAYFSKRSASAGLATRERHRLAMSRAAIDLDAASGLLVRGPDRYDVTAEELRSAIRALESLVGRIDAESLLDEIFASFCIGK
ncbi:tRNA uridine-5-carboxymethylaminomethyl(34) synthesis GTPase MnmE [Sulfitobacter sp. LCG007]